MEKRIEEIKNRKAEIRKLLDSNEEIDFTALEGELLELNKEEKSLNEQIEAASLEVKEAEARKLAAEEEARKLNDLNLDKTNKREKDEGGSMGEKKYTIASPEYRTGWAKTMMGLADEHFTEAERRALGDAIFTTDSVFVPAADGTQGINNGGLLIPTDVRTDILEVITQLSPFFRDIRKLRVAGNIDLPFLDMSEDANWYAELEPTKNEGVKLAKITLTGHELAKNVEVTWKLEKMAVAEFIPFITQEIAMKMGKALVNAIIYGDGVDKATGALYGLTPVDGTGPIDAFIQAYKALSQEARIGAKAYISTNANIDIVSFQDKNGNYPFLMGVGANKLAPMEVDPFLKDNDILVGNPIQYIMNESESISVVRETNVKGRRNLYGSYAIIDGKPRPGFFAVGTYPDII